MSNIIRIGNGQGFWGDSIDAPVRLAKDGPLDYLTLDYLAEVTLSIMQRQKLQNPSRGYARDFLDLVEKILPEISDNGVKVITNAGGVNALKYGTMRNNLQGIEIVLADATKIRVMYF